MDAGNRGMGLLVVGAGFLGAQRAAAAVAARGARLIAVADTDAERARAVAARHGVAHAEGLSSGLSLDGVDAVVIATPHADHAGQVREALDAGKHVLCEKPLAINADDAFDLARRADRLGLRLATGFNHRLYPPVCDALDLVHGWAIGRVEGVRVQIGHRASAEFLAGWHADPERSGGGTLADNGPHACDLIRRFMGEVVAGQGYLSNALDLPRGCESDAVALFRDHDRAVAELRSSWRLESGYLTIDVRGSDGELHIETAPWRLTGRLADGKRIDRRYLSERVIERCYRRLHGCERSLVRELESFVAPEDGRPAAFATGWDGCRAAEMVEAVYRSAATGREVELRPTRLPLPRRERESVVGRVG